MESRNTLKGWFKTGDKPTEGQFAAFIDSCFNLNDDTITIAMVQGLAALLAGKISIGDLANYVTVTVFNTNTGDLTTLDTTAKSSLVAAINELYSISLNIPAAPVLPDEAAAVVAGLPPFTLYKTATGELRYKLPTDDTSRFTNQFSTQFN